MALQSSPAQLQLLCQESQQTSLLAMQWSFTVIAVVVMSLRLYCRTKFGKGLCWDDYIYFTGAVGFLPFYHSRNGSTETGIDEAKQIIGLPGPFLATKWVHTGLGKHIECLDPDRAYATVQWSIASQAPHIVVSHSSKSRCAFASSVLSIGLKGASRFSYGSILRS